VATADVAVPAGSERRLRCKVGFVGLLTELEEARRDLAERGVEAEVALAVGHPAAEILEAAEHAASSSSSWAAQVATPSRGS
jgi:hypothetical protein